mgnify:CR=1 FL=1
MKQRRPIGRIGDSAVGRLAYGAKDSYAYFLN